MEILYEIFRQTNYRDNSDPKWILIGSCKTLPLAKNFAKKNHGYCVQEFFIKNKQTNETFYAKMDKLERVKWAKIECPLELDFN